MIQIDNFSIEYEGQRALVSFRGLTADARNHGMNVKCLHPTSVVL